MSVWGKERSFCPKYCCLLLQSHGLVDVCKQFLLSKQERLISKLEGDIYITKSTSKDIRREAQTHVRLRIGQHRTPYFIEPYWSKKAYKNTELIGVTSAWIWCRVADWRVGNVLKINPEGTGSALIWALPSGSWLYV